MPAGTLSHAVESRAELDGIATPALWSATVAALMLLLAIDLVLTRRSGAERMGQAVGWSVFYLVLPLGFGAGLWAAFGGATAVEFFTGFVVEKSLSVDHLFVFMLLLSAFAVPSAPARQVLLYGIAGALLLRVVLVGLGAAALGSGTWAFLLFGAVVIVTAWKILNGDGRQVDVRSMWSVRLVRRFAPVTGDHRGSRLFVRDRGRLASTPPALAVVAILATDVVFAAGSVPAVYGVTDDPYLVFAANAFALLGLRALYVVLRGGPVRPRHLGHGLSVILAFIGVKLVLRWAHGIWTWVPEVPASASLAFIVAVLVVVTATSLIADRRARLRAAAEARAGRVPEARKSWSAAIRIPEEDGVVRGERAEEDWESREVREALRDFDDFDDFRDFRGLRDIHDLRDLGDLRDVRGLRDSGDRRRGAARLRGATGHHGPGPPFA
ncbi:TerC/Alx family metal homeostasis membrane protein [Nonomuraea terrae]|uniref:TerC/Alx family metal homeostasis membrane protein n=1 Tax=Nonomuraea terrae TaxID=2530383 RepID=A0A4R4YCR7_9ACTN|nr:TerC/Alx family metal homeostasis membrane protein [Nonomuraea terrae]TDD41674.1 TerC/Alx family metal homeostasis membrane protein [Nonomuraea terrae]